VRSGVEYKQFCVQPFEQKPGKWRAAVVRVDGKPVKILGGVRRQHSYSYKKRLERSRCRLRGARFPVGSEATAKKWPEKGERDFQWFSPTDAAKVVREPVLREMIRAFPRRKRIDRNG
jgi:hypothetical protein